MATMTPQPLTDLEARKSFYLERLAQIDRILRPPVETLISLAPQEPRSATNSFRFPALLSDKTECRPTHSPHTQALCFATLQKLWRLRRRFPWLTDNGKLKNAVEGRLIEWFLPKSADTFGDIARLLDSSVLGNLNPLTASYVFRVLLGAGELYAHSGLGFLAVFAMLWPLYRRYPERLSPGARIEPWEPSAYVTSHCLLPVHKVQRIASFRAELLARVLGHMTNLEVQLAHLKGHLAQADERSCWLFNLELDALSADLRRLARLSLVRDELTRLADDVAAMSSELTVVGTDLPARYQGVYDMVVGRTRAAVRMIGEHCARVKREIDPVLAGIETSLLSFLDARGQMPKDRLLKMTDEELRRIPVGGDGKADLNLRFAEEWLYDPDYWKDLSASARRAWELCCDLQAIVVGAGLACAKIDAGKSTWDEVAAALSGLIQANRDVIDRLNRDTEIKEAGQWCRTIMDREIAHASAGNLTDFDPAELVSAIAVAVRLKLITTRLQVSDAVAKALKGARKDGSWWLGLPYYSPDNALGIWPATSEVIWTLAGAIRQEPNVSVADKTLFRYLDWLERTQTRFRSQGREVWGWASERMRHSGKIHLLTTAFSINALLEIRDLIEYRLWQLCEKRFAAVGVTKRLKDVDPVDLDLPHEARLHSQLARMARETQGDHFASADDYSLILHGPPGSSKTQVAEALAAEMWTDSKRWGRRQARFIRVTPADFTRLGEDRLDSEARFIFDLLGHVRGVTVFFDEIDDLLRRRDMDPSHRPTFMELVVPAMLNRLADLRGACPRQEICFLLATNYIENIERALTRPGRIDRQVPVVYPDWSSRVAILMRHLQKRHPAARGPLRLALESKLGAAWADKTSGWPWMVLKRACETLCERMPAEAFGDVGEEGLEDKVDAVGRKVFGIMDRVIEANRGSFEPPDYAAREESAQGCKAFRAEYDRYVAASSVRGIPEPAETEKLSDHGDAPGRLPLGTGQSPR